MFHKRAKQKVYAAMPGSSNIHQILSQQENIEYIKDTYRVIYAHY